MCVCPFFIPLLTQVSRTLDGQDRASKIRALSGLRVSTELPVMEDAEGNRHLYAKKETRGEPNCLVLGSGDVTASVSVT